MFRLPPTNSDNLDRDILCNYIILQLHKFKIIRAIALYSANSGVVVKSAKSNA